LIDAVLHAVDRLRLRPALRHGEIEGAVVERENADELLGRDEDLVLVNGDPSKQSSSSRTASPTIPRKLIESVRGTVGLR